MMCYNRIIKESNFQGEKTMKRIINVDKGKKNGKSKSNRL